MAAAIRLGLVGYGVGGRVFHAPFIEAADGVELAGIVTRSAQRRAQVRQDWPGVPTYDTLAGLLETGVDAVTITTPPKTRQALVLQAVAAGAHVVADKPFAPSAAAARTLAQAAEDAGVILNVFHNRRWDADIRTLAAVLASGRLGELWRVHTRFDLDPPHLLEPGPGGGLLRDLGSHVVDQMLWLLGPVTTVTAHLDWVDLPEGRTDAGFVVDLLHASGVRSFVESTKLNRLHQRELRSYGSAGSYRAVSSDVQAQAVLGGPGRLRTSRAGATTLPNTGAPSPPGRGWSSSPRSKGATTTFTPSSRPPYVEMRQSRFLRPRGSGPSRSWTPPGSAPSAAGRWRSSPYVRGEPRPAGAGAHRRCSGRSNWVQQGAVGATAPLFSS